MKDKKAYGSQKSILSQADNENAKSYGSGNAAAVVVNGESAKVARLLGISPGTVLLLRIFRLQYFRLNGVAG